MTTTFYLITEDQKQPNVIVQEGGLFNQLIPYTEQPACAKSEHSPFGEHSAHMLFSLFTADIIEANIQFTR